jgi:hypothetical protein
MAGSARRAALDQLGLEQLDHRLGESVDVGVSDCPDRSADADGGQPLGERERCELRPADLWLVAVGRATTSRGG